MIEIPIFPILAGFALLALAGAVVVLLFRRRPGGG